MRDQRHSVNVITTAEVALYILNNKRSFITQMESRSGLTISVQASDRVQGANFIIEKAHAVAAPKAPERAAVNMDWGFEGQDAGAEAEGEDDAPTHSHAHGGEARQNGEGEGRRRRRRRRGRRDDRGERNGNGDARRDQPHDLREAGADDEAGHDDHEHQDGEQQEVFDVGGGEAAADEAGAERHAEDGGNGDQQSREERGGRRRRRGRRGGRRGRDRERGEGQRSDERGQFAGTGEQPDVEGFPGETRETGFFETMPAAANDEHTPVAEARPVQAAEPVREVPAVQRPAEPVTRIPSIEPIAPMPAPVQVASAPQVQEEPAVEDSSRPMRKGWWQRRFSSE